MFFIDTRSVDQERGTLSIHCFDSMLMGEQQNPAYGTDITVVGSIASVLGVTLDASVTAAIVNGYTVPKSMTDLSAREVLKNIGAAYGGCFYISKGNMLAFRSFRPSSSAWELGQNVATLSIDVPWQAVSKIIVKVDDNTSYSAGDTTGRTVTVDCQFGTQAMANNLLTLMSGYVYTSYEADDAIIDPLVEIGDSVHIGSLYSIIAEIHIKADMLFTADLSAPSSGDIDHEYPYELFKQTIVPAKNIRHGGSYGSLSGSAISTGSINAQQIADAAISTAKLAVESVTAAILGPAAVTAVKLATGSVSTDKIADDAISTAKLAAQSVTASILAASAVTTDKIANNAVDSNKIDIPDLLSSLAVLSIDAQTITAAIQLIAPLANITSITCGGITTGNGGVTVGDGLLTVENDAVSWQSKTVVTGITVSRTDTHNWAYVTGGTMTVAGYVTDKLVLNVGKTTATINYLGKADS